MPQPYYQFQQGADQLVTLEVNQDGQIQDLSNAENVKVVLYIQGKIEDYKITFALENNEGEPPLTIDPDTKALKLAIEGNVSRHFPTGILVADVKAWLPDVNFPDGNREELYGMFTLGNVQKGNLKDLDI